jgi:hypothetical protein
MWTHRLRSRASEPLVAVCFVRVGYFEKFVADADGNHSVAVQFRCAQKGFQYGLLLAHGSLRSKKGDDLFCSVGTRRQKPAFHIDARVKVRSTGSEWLSQSERRARRR